MAALRSRQLAILGGGAGVILLLMVGLAFTGASAQQVGRAEVPAVPPVEPIRFEAPLPKARAAVTPKLVTTAQLCRELARVGDSTSCPALLERAAKVLDASGIIVWVAEPSRQRLRPAMSHGYDDQSRRQNGQHPPRREQRRRRRLSLRPRSARSPETPVTSGAVIVPLMTSDGCVGVLSAEMKSGSEKDESSQALATIFAAQLATLVATPSAASRQARRPRLAVRVL